MLTMQNAKQNIKAIRPNDQVRFACPNFGMITTGWDQGKKHNRHKYKRFLP